MTKRILNWKPSLPDHRDFAYRHVELLASHVVLPPIVDLRPKCSPVVDQGQMGSCSGNASASAIEFLELQELEIPGLQPQEYGSKLEAVSRLFIYWNERALEGSTNSDAGATTLRDACRVLAAQGVCRESTWTYEEDHLLAKPSAAAYAEASQHKAGLYYGLDGIYELKRCLYNGYPFLFGTSVYSSFMGEDAARTGLIPMPSAYDSLEGGHALLCVGYDDAKQCFIFKNSWGTSWGDQGYGYLPYNYMMTMSDDFFTIRRIPTLNP